MDIMWIQHFLVFAVIIVMEVSPEHHIETEQSIEDTYLERFENIKENTLKTGGRKSFSYSEWARWSACIGGRKTRRRHCLRRQVCGDSLRIEVTSCHKSGRGNQHNHIGEHNRHEREPEQHILMKNVSFELPRRYVRITWRLERRRMLCSRHNY